MDLPLVHSRSNSSLDLEIVISQSCLRSRDNQGRAGRESARSGNATRRSSRPKMGKVEPWCVRLALSDGIGLLPLDSSPKSKR